MIVKSPSDELLPAMTKSVSVRCLLENYLDVQACIDACKACPRYGKRCTCPPFDYDPVALMRKYEVADLFLKKVNLDTTLTMEQALSEIKEIGRDLCRKVIELEGRIGGHACGLAADEKECSRCLYMIGKSCNNRASMRPSLEAYGLDVVKLMENEFGLSPVWGKDGMAPPYLLLVVAHFHS